MSWLDWLFPKRQLPSGDWVTAILSQHNQERSVRGVPPLTWDGGLAVSAQAWANRIAATGSFCHSNTPGVGENLAEGGVPVTELSQLWINERRYFVPGLFPNISCTGSWVSCGHYSQIIWRNTHAVGCGVATRSRNLILVAHYAPAGNVMGQPVF